MAGRCKDSYDCVEIGGGGFSARFIHVYQRGETIEMWLRASVTLVAG